MSIGCELLLERIFSKVDQIPTFPKVALKALELLRKEEVDYRELEGIIKGDPGIASNFLKIVNSALYSLPRKVDSLSQAFMYLGVDQIKFILLASAVGRYFDRPMIGYGINAKDLWIHSIACGIAGELITLKLGFSQSFKEKVYFACLLHDIGKIILDLYTKLEVEEFKRSMKENQDYSFMQIEWLLLGVDHGLIGSELLRRWEFPEDIVFAIRAHHDETLMLQRKLSAIVALANVVANLVGLYSGIDSFYYYLPEDLCTFLELSSEDLMNISLQTLKNALTIDKILG